jgi:SAM-dependent methyltransferase
VIARQGVERWVDLTIIKNSDCAGNVEIRVDNDRAFEKVSAGRHFFNYCLWFPLVNVLPKELGVRLFTKSSEHTRLIRKFSKSHKALELMYGYEGYKVNGNGVLDAVATHFWETAVINASAVRNRLKLIKKILREVLSEKKGGKQIKVLSLASGSARAVIEVMAELKDMDIRCRFVDISREALEFSKQLADTQYVASKIGLLRANVLEVGKICANWEPDIIEVVGLFDYLDDSVALKFISDLRECLEDNGVLLISNVNDNPERRFVKEVVDWDMIYRTPEELANLLVSGGFVAKDCRIICEPLKIHSIAVARKLA